MFLNCCFINSYFILHWLYSFSILYILFVWKRVARRGKVISLHIMMNTNIILNLFHIVFQNYNPCFSCLNIYIIFSCMVNNMMSDWWGCKCRFLIFVSWISVLAWKTLDTILEIVIYQFCSYFDVIFLKDKLTARHITSKFAHGSLCICVYKPIDVPWILNLNTSNYMKCINYKDSLKF